MHAQHPAQCRPHYRQTESCCKTNENKKKYREILFNHRLHSSRNMQLRTIFGRSYSRIRPLPDFAHAFSRVAFPNCAHAFSRAALPIRNIWFNTIWCRRRDSNSHDFRHRPLKTACLPIPPRRPIRLRVGNSAVTPPHAPVVTLESRLPWSRIH